jgi:hypothetical protein
VNIAAEQLAEWRELWKAATRGVWQNGTAGSCNLVDYDGDDISGVGYVGGEADRALIIQMHKAFPSLLDEVKRLRARERELGNDYNRCFEGGRALMDWLSDYHPAIADAWERFNQ